MNTESIRLLCHRNPVLRSLEIKVFRLHEQRGSAAYYTAILDQTVFRHRPLFHPGLCQEGGEVHGKHVLHFEGRRRDFCFRLIQCMEIPVDEADP